MYVDWTLEIIPRVFYVGKGKSARINRRERNADHKKIVKEFGIHREVVLETDDENVAYTYEEQLVEFFDTFLGWGVNLTKGGWGRRSGWKHSKHARQKISSVCKGKPSPKRGTHLSDEQKKKMSEKMTGRKLAPFSEERRKNMSKAQKGKPSPHRGRKLSDEHKQKISVANKGQLSHNKGKKKIR